MKGHGQLGTSPNPRAFLKESSEFFQVSGYLCKEKDIYEDSRPASLGPSLFQVPEPTQEVKLGIFIGKVLGIFLNPRAFIWKESYARRIVLSLSLESKSRSCSVIIIENSSRRANSSNIIYFEVKLQ